MKKILLKIVKISVIVLLSLGLLLLAAKLVLDKKLPKGEEGPKAEALAQKMLNSINHSAWDSTAAIRWSFDGRHELLWDKERKLARVTWNDYTAFINCHTREGYALENGEPIQGVEKEKSVVEDAYAWWANDSYWLNPVSKIYDDGVTRSYVPTEDGNGALLVSYASGGVTPGDSYLWYVDQHGRPYKWEMWVKIIPIKGAESTWEEWKRSETKVSYSGLHKMGPMELNMLDVEMTHDLQDWLGAEDPFADLVK